MKNTYFFLMMAMSLSMVGCNQKPTSQEDGKDDKQIVETVQTEKTNRDLGFVENGQLKFYDAQKGEIEIYTCETDSVVDAVCSTKGKVYYNVMADKHLLLKCLDMNSPDLMSESLADWNLDFESREENPFPAFGKMYLSMDQTQIALEVDVMWFAGPCYNLAVYDCSSKTIEKITLYKFDEEQGNVDFMDDEDTFRAYAPEANFDFALFEDADGLYYLGDGQRVCLNDQLKEMEDMEDFDMEFDHDPIELDPTGKKLLFATSTYLGDGLLGFFAVSSLDGKTQIVLPDSDLMEVRPQWLSNGSLVYTGYDDDATLFLMDVDGKIRPIAHANRFFVLP